jgi:hypothetical protein
MAGDRKTQSQIRTIKSQKKKRKKILKKILTGNDNKPRDFKTDAKNLLGEYESPPEKFDVRDVVKKTNTINKKKKQLKKRMEYLKK